MAITVVCPACGKAVTAPDSLLGKQINCQSCGEAMTYAPSSEVPEVEVPPPGSSAPSFSAAYDATDELSATDWVLCFLCGPIMCPVGIVRLITGNPKGLKTIGAVFLAHCVWAAFAAVVELASMAIKHR